jgi:hypothetical protein
MPSMKPVSMSRPVRPGQLCNDLWLPAQPPEGWRTGPGGGGNDAAPKSVPGGVEQAGAQHPQRSGAKYSSPDRTVIRAKIILLTAEGQGDDVVAAPLDTPRRIVSKWRMHFCLFPLPGLDEQHLRGRPPVFSPRCSSRRQDAGGMMGDPAVCATSRRIPPG